LLTQSDFESAVKDARFRTTHNQTTKECSKLAHCCWAKRRWVEPVSVKNRAEIGVEFRIRTPHFCSLNAIACRSTRIRKEPSMTDDNQVRRLLRRATLSTALLLTAVSAALANPANQGLNPPTADYAAHPASMNRDIHSNQVQPEDGFSFGAR
jgi:hypothetical protein